MARNNELQEWKDRLNVAHKKFDVVKPKIERAWSYYRGHQWQENGKWSITGYKDKPVDNIVFSNIRAIVPRLNFRNPKINVRPKKKPFRLNDGIFDTLAASASLEVVLNYYYKTLQIKREARKCLYDALLSPKGIMELGYTVKTEKIKDDELLDVNELISEDSPFCMRRDPMEFRQDPEGIDANLNDARWIALRWVKPLEDLKKDDKYSNTTNLKCNYKIKTEFDSPVKRRDEVNPEDDQGVWGRVEGWTVWDKKKRRIMEIVEGHDKFLRNESSWPLELDGFPVEILYFNENSGDSEPIPDVWQYLDMQDELNRISSLQLDHIRRISQRRYIAREGAFTEDQVLKIAHGGDGTLAFTSMGVADSIQPLTDATISQDIYMIRQGLKNTIREMAGVSGMEAMVSQKFDQATEPALIEQASKSLRGDQQSTFENFLVRVVEKLASIIQQTTDEVSIPLDAEQMNDKDLRKLLESKMSKIDSPEGAITLMPWVDLDKNDLKGDYIYEIEIGSTMPYNEQQDKQDAVALYQLMNGNPYIRGREGTKAVLDAFKRPDPDKLLKSEEEVAQLSMMNHQMQVQAEQAMDKPKRDVDLLKTQIKSQTTKDVAAMKMHGDAQKIAMDSATHKLDLIHKEQDHQMSMSHEIANQEMDKRQKLIDLISAAKMANLKVSEKEAMSEINLKNALKKGSEKKKDDSGV